MLKVLIYQKPYGIDMHVLSHPGFKILIEISEQKTGIIASQTYKYILPTLIKCY